MLYYTILPVFKEQLHDGLLYYDALDAVYAFRNLDKSFTFDVHILPI
jgi:hypothetical protein